LSCIAALHPPGKFAHEIHCPPLAGVYGLSRDCYRASLGAGCASDPDPVVVGQPLTLPNLNEYCAVAQKDDASSRVPARNVLVTDYQAFSRDST
jgi:hypothetical protein